MPEHDPTTDPRLRSFIEVPTDHPFPIQNLPYGAFRPKKGGGVRIGVAIGDYVMDITALDEKGLLHAPSPCGKSCFSRQSTLNRFMAAGRPAWQEARRRLSELLRHDNPTLRDNLRLRDATLLPLGEVEMRLPVDIGDYTDFYASEYHARNVGTMFRGKENALLPNWKWVPVGYHGRASSVVLSGTTIRRPSGQSKTDDADEPVFGPSRLLDFELEMGFFVGTGNPQGEPIPVEETGQHIFGMAIVNDWSARDIQKWEYIPLGPFLSKNFATSVSPWIVTMDALAPFRCSGPAQDPAPLPYLRGPDESAYDIHLEVHIKSGKMNKPTCISRSNLKHMYWSIYQQLAHHTVSGCNVRPGDLMASGTISGPTPDSYGSLLELTWRGSKPLRLSDDEQRSFLEDGDTVTMSGWCQGDGYRVGFGDVNGMILPSAK